MMKEQFTKADKSGKGMAGPAANSELVLYEFISMLVRIAFQRANPTHGNHGNKKAVVHLPGCLESMLVDEILPRARKDTSAAFREKVMTELSVLSVISLISVLSEV